MRYFTIDTVASLAVPSSPTNLQVQSLHMGELYITWDPPSQPKGNVTHYQVYWTLRHLNATAYELRDYCTYRMYTWR